MNNTAEVEKVKRIFQEVIRDVSKGFNQTVNANITVENIGGTYYAFGSELDCLRLFRGYNKVNRNPKTDCGYSTNLGTFYFRLEQ